MLDRTFDGVLKVVRTRMPNAPRQLLEDALLMVIERLVRNDHGPKDKIFFYLVNAACQQAKNLLQRDPSLQDLELSEAEARYLESDRPEYAFEQSERGRIALEYLLSITRTWDSAGMALVTELHLRAALDEEPLSAEEAAEIASGVLDRDLTPANARQLKSRGFTRLARELDPNNPTPFEEDDQ